MDTPPIPDKMYFRIGEVAELTGVKPSVLRYWETEFGTLRPSKSQSNQRLYSRADIEKIFKLKTLLYEKKFTIAGARRVLAKGFDRELIEIGEEPAEAAGNGVAQPLTDESRDALLKRVHALISEVRSIKELLR